MKPVTLKTSKYAILILFALLFGLLHASLAHEGHSHEEHSHGDHHDSIKKYTFIVGNYMTSSIVRSIKTIWQEYPFIKDRVNFELISKTDLDSGFNPTEIMDSDIIMFDVHGIRLSTPTQSGFDSEVLKGVIHKGATILAIGETKGLNTQYAAIGLTYDSEIRSYFKHRNPENFKNMILLSLKKYLRVPELNVKPFQEGLKMAYYHRHEKEGRLFKTFEEYKQWYREAGYYKEGAEWVAVLTFSSFYEQGQTAVEDELANTLEEKGLNAFTAFGYPASEVIEKLLIDPDGVSRVSGILSFLFRFSNFKAADSLEKCGVPVINLITVYGKDGKTWENDPVGLSSLEVSWQLAIPEIAGLIQPTVVSYRMRERDDETGFFVEQRKDIPGQVRSVVNRMRAWINLQNKENSDKKVAILYWNYPPGKQQIGASYLNVFASIENVLKKMKDSGFNVGHEKIDKDVLLDNSLNYGRNIGTWAPGELDKMISGGKCVLLSLEEYRKWSRKLPAEFIKDVNSDWGPVEESDVMMWTDPKQNKKFMVIPTIQRGNVVILPQPVRDWLQDKEAMYHNKDLAPHHQYVGVYLWLKYGFGADGVIHFGTHGTHEWLPGKSNGLSGDDPPEALVQDLPVIYPYIVDDVGEGIVAKRRGAAVVIDHMIPPLKKGGLYHEYAELEELISDHHRSLDQDAALARQYMENIIKKIKALGLEKDIEISESLNVDAENGDPHKFDHEVIHSIGEYLDELKELNMPYGLHTFGKEPEVSLRASTIQAIREVAADISATELDKHIQEGAERELSSTINAMNGRYIPTGTGNDPVRNPNSLPTGKNFYAFNPDKIPKKEAWQVGVKLTKELLDNYRAENNGKYPDKLSFVIWGTETIRHEGILESQILYLLGVEPIWNEWGKVTGIQIIPKDVLGRPRIDIVVSSAAEEMFGQLTQYIDQAVQMVKMLDEEHNLVRRHIREVTENLIQQGWPKKKAEQYAAVRIFDEPPGRYDLNVSRIVSASGSWKDDSVVAEDYLKHMSYGYGNGLWGEPMEDVYKMVLSGTDMVLHSRSTNLYGTLDNDDFFMYAGGLAATIRELDGESPDLVVTNVMNPARPEMTTIDRMMGMEFRSRYWNPEWIKGMKKEGFEGANKMAEFVENMWGWQVTMPETIDAARWEQTYDVYVTDKYGMDLEEFFSEKNPYAYQALVARMLDTIRKGYWQPIEVVKQTLAAEYIASVTENSAACSENICNNPDLEQYAMDVATHAGLLTNETQTEYTERMKNATGKALNERKEEISKLIKTQAVMAAQGPGQTMQDKKSEDKPDESTEQKTDITDLEETEVIEGYEMKEEDQETEEGISKSNISRITVIVIMICLGLFYYGWRKGRKQC
ncbi:MAG: cobaltochelatase [Candidatus Scalindua rubra]|uniref:Cobaltochelatase n=1 Tax=Candidatus Scalindua rubra TaxID=1872076 RepID=A0A1E3X9Z0_9BACT|nr:MAG: cobaltochelatase [Candidatus Scalindua rubra]